MKIRQLVFPILLLMLLLTGCAQSDPVATVEAYLEARTTSDLNTMLTLSCAAWEAQAAVEATSFESMNAELQNMACQIAGEADGFTLVECSGVIATVYNGETREWDLGAFPFQLVQEDGEWRMCGLYGAEDSE
jgi:hypothetical protein